MSENLAFPQVDRDAKRAFRERRDECTIWLMPGLVKNVRWQEGPFERMLAIPAEHLDRIDIYHIGENGHAWGADSGNRFPQGRIHRLLAVWLTMPIEALELGLLPEETSVHLPRFKDGKHVGYEDVTINLRSVGAIPLKVVDKEKRVVEWSWPPEGRPISISPDAEGMDLYGKLSRTALDGIPILTSAKDPKMRSLPLCLQWPPIIRELMPRGAGLDEVLAWHSMVKIAEQNENDHLGALNEIQRLARDFVSDSIATRASAWLLPIFAATDDEGILLENIENDLGFRAKSLAHLLRMPKARKSLNEEVPVRRAWGARGLFWALLLERLESGGRFARCELCGQLNPASHRRKQFCGRSDNETCFLRRTAN